MNDTVAMVIAGEFQSQVSAMLVSQLFIRESIKQVTHSDLLRRSEHKGLVCL